MKKWRILLVTLVISTQLSAQTVGQALGETMQDFLSIVNTHLNDFQKRKLKNLNSLLGLDITVVTPEQLERINGEISAFVDIVSPKLESSDDESDIDGDDFAELAQTLRGQVDLLLNPPAPMEEVILPEPPQEVARTFSLANDTPLTSTSTSDDTNQNMALAQLAQELSPLDETSYSDPDTFLLANGDILEDFLNERMPTLDSTSLEDYQNSLEAFLREKKISESAYRPVLSELATRLRNMQTIYYEPEEDEDDTDALLAGLSAQELDELALEFGIAQQEADEALPLSTKQRKYLNIVKNLMLDKAQAPLAALSPEDVNKLLQLETNSSALQDLQDTLGTDEAAIQTMLLSTSLNESERNELTQHILRLINKTSSKKFFVINLQRLNRACEDPETMKKYDSVHNFVHRYNTFFMQCINACKSINNTSVASADQLKEALVKNFAKLNISEDNYATALPALTEELVVLQKTMNKKPRTEKQKEYRKKLKTHHNLVKLLSTSPEEFIEKHRSDIESAMMSNKSKKLNYGQRQRLVESFLEKLGLDPKAYDKKTMDTLRNKTRDIQDEIWREMLKN